MNYYRFIAVLFLTVFLFACERKKEVPLVHIGHAPHDHHAAMYVAAVKGGYFKEHGGVYLLEEIYKKKYRLYRGETLLANVDIDSGTGGIHLIRKLDEKILDVSFGGVPAMIEMMDGGSRIKIVAPVMTEGAAFAVSGDMPVNDWDSFVKYVKKTEETVRVGYKVEVSVQNLIFESALREEGLTFTKDLESAEAEIALINLHGPKNLIPSLKAGVIDGFVVMQPFPALAEYESAGKIIAHLRSLPPEGMWHDHPCCALAANEDFIESDSEIVEALVELFYHANLFLSENSEESAEITSSWLGTPVQVESKSLPTINFLTNYSAEWNKGVSFWISSLINRGLLSGNVKQAYENDSVDKLIYDNTFYDNVRNRNSN